MTIPGYDERSSQRRVGGLNTTMKRVCELEIGDRFMWQDMVREVYEISSTKVTYFTMSNDRVWTSNTFSANNKMYVRLVKQNT